MTRALPFTQTAIRKAIRAARREGCGAVEIKPDGSIVVKVGDSVEPYVAVPSSAPSKWEDQEA